MEEEKKGLVEQISNSNKKTYTEVREEIKNMSKEDKDKIMEDAHKKYMEDMKKQREEIFRKWEEAGFLDGLRGYKKGIDGVNMKLYEGRTSSIILSGDTKNE